MVTKRATCERCEAWPGGYTTLYNMHLCPECYTDITELCEKLATQSRSIMPEIIYYEVLQTREVRVRANSSIDALRIAQAAFENGQNSGDGVIDGPEGVWGNTSNRVKERDLSVTREMF